MITATSTDAVRVSWDSEDGCETSVYASRDRSAAVVMYGEGAALVVLLGFIIYLVVVEVLRWRRSLLSQPF